MPDKYYIMEILKKNIHFNYFDEILGIPQEEKLPPNGWESFDYKNALIDFRNNLRSIIKYFNWFFTEKINELNYLKDMLFNSDPDDSFNKIKKIYGYALKWIFIGELFDLDYEVFGDLRPEEILIKFSLIEQLSIAKGILNKNKLEFETKFDVGFNRVLLSRYGFDKEGADISKQGHGIRTLILVILSCIFCNFLFIDEPENGLHITLQKDLMRYVINAKDTQSFLVTHSPSIIPHNQEASIYLINNKNLIYRDLFPERWTDHNDFIKKNKEHIRNIIGVYPEDLLFEKGIIFFEGKTDASFYSDIFLDYGIKLDYPRGVSNLKKSWQTYKDFIAKNVIEKFIFLFDRDHFNEIIADIDNEHAFTLPCYSKENLLLDPLFLSKIFEIDREKINKKIVELLKFKKEKTLDTLFIVSLFRSLKGNASKALEKLSSIIKVDWNNPDSDKLINELYEIWSLEDNIEREDINKSAELIKEISKDWEKQYLKHTEVKSELNNYLRQLAENFGIEEIPTEKSLKPIYLKFIKENLKSRVNDLPESITKDFLELCKQILKKL